MTKFNSPSKEEIIHDAEIFKTIKFGATKPSPEDNRDFVARLTNIVQLHTTFPEEYESDDVEILNQGNVSSCVAHACCSALAEGEQIKYYSYRSYSPGYIYGNRAASDYQGEGMIIRQALKGLNKSGAVLYSDFPHNLDYPVVKSLITEKEKELAELAAPHKIVKYFRCENDDDIKETIMNNGSVIICVPVYTDFGRDLHPTTTNHLVGYHAMIIKGWTKDNKWIVQNSWGYFWGYAGKLLMDSDYPVNEAWGIVVNTNDESLPNRKDSILVILLKKIINFFKNLFRRRG